MDVPKKQMIVVEVEEEVDPQVLVMVRGLKCNAMTLLILSILLPFLSWSSIVYGGLGLAILNMILVVVTGLLTLCGMTAATLKKTIRTLQATKTLWVLISVLYIFIAVTTLTEAIVVPTTARYCYSYDYSYVTNTYEEYECVRYIAWTAFSYVAAGFSCICLFFSVRLNFKSSAILREFGERGCCGCCYPVSTDVEQSGCCDCSICLM